MPLRHRRDGNHKALVNALEHLGWTVCDTSQGCQVGAPDLFIAKAGRVVACEVKSLKGKTSPWQDAFLNAWPGETAVLRSVDDVIALNRSGQATIQPTRGGSAVSPGDSA
jgi:hypothetical protein